MSTNRSLRWFYWMLYAMFAGGILLTVAGLGGYFDSITGNSTQDIPDILGTFFYTGFFGMGLGALIVIVMMFVLDESSINDVEPQNKVLRITVLIFSIAAIVIYAVLTFTYKWRGVFFIVNASNCKQNTPLVLFFAYVVLCGIVGYYIFLQLIESEGDITQYITVVTKTYDFAPSSPVTYSENNPHIHKGQFIGFGLLGVLFSLLGALTPLCFPIFAFCCTGAMRMRSRAVLIVIYVLTALLGIVGIVLPFII